MRKRYDGLLGIRGIGALGVIAYHVYVLGGFYGISSTFDRTVGNGGVFVQLFFMLSGLSLMCGYYEEFNDKPDLDKFYIGRIKKLVPTFWLALILHCIIDLYVGTPISKFNVIGTASLMFGFMPTYQESLVMAGWALGIEIVFYLVFPAVFVFNRNKKRSWLFLLFSAIMFITYESFYGIGHTPINIIRQLVFFAVGLLIYHYTDVIENMQKNNRVLLFVACIIIEVLSFVAYGRINGNVVMIIAFTALIINQIGFKDYVVNNRLFKGFGKISYQMYLLHMVVYKLLYNLGILQKVKQFVGGIEGFLIQFSIVLIGTVIIATIVNMLLSRLNSIQKRKEV